MLKKLSIPLMLLLFGYFVISDENIKIIFAGIAIFIIGMNFMEEGFKLFSGGTLEKLLEKFTNNLYKAIFTGFFTTSIVQSSSLISVITISFLSVNLITLTQGIGIIFGSNLGSTTTAWLVTIFGLKLKISSFAMPMIIFGVVFKFLKIRMYRGLGNILLGLGFIFLGIAYMKEGFETLRSAIDLASYFIDGYLGIVLYALIGFFATIVIQSSSATIAIVITALATGQIHYESALALAIGSNVGTTVTAILGSLTSNENGKRLAFAHFVFNIITGAVAIGFIYQLSDVVNIMASYFNIEATNYTIKLAIFHTTFNLLGILLVSPFISLIESSSKLIFKTKSKSTAKPKYISDVIIDVPNSALLSLEKELHNLFNKAQKAILHAISLRKKEVVRSQNLKKNH
jgi:phosphate:Na+ symporter